MSGNAITLENVTKRYGEVTALDDVTLEMEPGEFQGLVGPNGSGKTTMYRMIAGLTAPTEGTIERNGADVGFSFQEPRFFPELTVRQNVEVFRSFDDDPEPDEWMEKLIDDLRLRPAIHRRASDVSGGFRKKLDLTLAFIQKPQFVLLDEPLADVDDYSRRRILSFLEKYQEEGRTVVVSTHNVESFTDLFTRFSILVDGDLLSDGDPEDDVIGQYRRTLETIA